MCVFVSVCLEYVCVSVCVCECVCRMCVCARVSNVCVCVVFLLLLRGQTTWQGGRYFVNKNRPVKGWKGSSTTHDVGAGVGVGVGVSHIVFCPM